jgi:rhodanese-related sulfurtransferase
MDGEFFSEHQPLRPVSPGITVAWLQRALARDPRIILLDVRRRPAFQDASTMIPGAEWRDPTQVYEWGSNLPRARLIVAYCSYGHHVGRWVAASLRSQGRDAWFLEGGIAAWEAAGLPLAQRELEMVS